MILSFHPNFINVRDLDRVAKQIEADHGCKIYLVPHMSLTADPLYCVQFTDTKNESRNRKEIN